MRKEFSASIEKIAKSNKKVIFMTGDLGFMALENLQKSLKNRFINAGVSEQNMMSLAAGLAREGLSPVCYSIAPFAVFRPAEQIRLDICLHNMNVKIVGNGGGYGYGIMGPTHHAIEDIAVIASFQNIKCYIPFCNEDVDEIVHQMMRRIGPAYLRLGLGKKPDKVKIPQYYHTRKILSGNSITAVAMGPISLNIFKSLELYNGLNNKVDLFVVSEMPLKELSAELKDSIRATGKLLVLEEHVKQGGLGENISSLILESGIPCKYLALYAKGYHNGLYGSQQYHQMVNGLDPNSIAKTIKELMNA